MCAMTDSTTIFAFAKVRALTREMKQARHNYNRQRARELARRTVRVPSSFWEAVARDYRKQILSTIILMAGEKEQ